MSSINFSDTTPGAPAGGVNLKWQTDDKGNISAYASKADITGGLVSSVFGRTGDVVAAAGDYNAGQVLYAVDQRVSYANPTWIASLDWSKITSVPANIGAVASVFGRTGAVVAASGDYAAAQITNAVDASQAYANPAWITSLAASKLTGAPPAAVIAAMQTPWLQNINAAGFQLQSAGNIGIGIAAPAYPLDIMGGAADGVIRTATTGGNVARLILQNGATGGRTWALEAYQNSINPAGGFGIQDITAGAQRLVINAGGNVGIGTTAPSKSLDVLSGSAIAAIFSSTGSAGAVGIGSNSGASIIQAYTDHTASAGAALCLQTSGGNVGIGTTTPADVLDVNGRIHLKFASGTGAGIWLDSSSATNQCFVGSDPSANVWRVYSSVIPGNCVTVNLASGNVGIGTTAPAYPLDVTGAARVSGVLECDSSSSLNLYYNGSSWVYRNNGAGLTLSYDTNGAYLNVAVNGAAGANATLGKVISVTTPAYVINLNGPTSVFAPAPGNATNEGAMPVANVMMTLTSNTQLTFRVKGTDAVIRQTTLTLA